MVICLYADNVRQYVFALLQGESEAFDKLYPHIQPELSRFFNHRCRSVMVAEDLEQETMVKIYNNITTLKSADRFWPWAYRIAHNCLIDYHRKSAKHRDIADINNVEIYNASAIASGVQEQPLYQLDQAERIDKIHDSVSQLSETHRIAIEHRCILKQAYGKVATELGCSRHGARLIVHRARVSLKDVLAKI